MYQNTYVIHYWQDRIERSLTVYDEDHANRLAFTIAVNSGRPTRLEIV